MIVAEVQFDNTLKSGGHIYLISCSRHKVLYVGQTNQKVGALGRLSQHVSETSSNTFIKRTKQIRRIDEINLGAVSFYAVRLPSERMFHSQARDYREAVEHIVQTNVRNYICREKTGYLLVSLTDANGYCRDEAVRAAADSVFAKLEPALAKKVD